VQLKANQPRLLAAVRRYCAQHVPEAYHSSDDLGSRSRRENRTVRLWSLPAGTGSHAWHDHFQVVIQVSRHTQCFNTGRKIWIPRREKPAYYLCTCRGTAQDRGQIIRNHWGIENRLHHGLDTTLHEDACRIRRNPGIFALLRHFALNLLRYNSKDNIKTSLYDNALNLDRLLAYDGI
jgi:predicted transposase YbfD/YdcC